MIDLNINIDHIATLRNARGGFEPDPILGAIESINAGADGIVCHLREDRRHIRDEDVIKLRELDTRLDLEMAVSNDIIELAFKVKPELVTIVPEKREELTTEGGLLIAPRKEFLKDLKNKFHDKDILVSLFVEPDIDIIDQCLDIGIEMLEFHTGHYANEYPKNLEVNLAQIKKAIDYAKSNGLRVCAGHGLNYTNTTEIAAIKGIDELSIGHSIISKSIFVGISSAVKEMKGIIENAQK